MEYYAKSYIGQDIPNMPQIKINNNFCKGCMLCIPVCPNDALEISHLLNAYGIHYAAFKRDGVCTGCKNCASICPDVAIEIYNGKIED